MAAVAGRAVNFIDKLGMIKAFCQTRWGGNFASRAALEAYQQRQLAQFCQQVAAKAPAFQPYLLQPFASWPLMDKTCMMQQFAQRNTLGIELDAAWQVAQAAEQSRDFSPQLGDVTVGMSSGTSGNRGVFLVSRQERARWAGIMLARALPTHLLRQLLTPWAAKLKIAFFLRANSNLYTSLQSSRLDFGFYDLLDGAAAALPRLNQSQPDVLVGPPALLKALAKAQQQGVLQIQPSHVLSVADVLEEADKQLLAATFGVAVHQLYQATEGFLGYSCEHGNLHLNERYLYIERRYVDGAQRRFQPIVTDFSRSTQLIVRYALNDVLRQAPAACPCGRVELHIEAIEGRSDDVLYLPALQPTSPEAALVAIYPDEIRRLMLLQAPEVDEYQCVQHGMTWRLTLQAQTVASAELEARLQSALAQLWQHKAVLAPSLAFEPWCAPALDAKRRRIRLLTLPENRSCMF